MKQFSNKPNAQPLSALTLAALSFLPLSAQAQEQPGKSEKPSAAPSSSLDNPFKDGVPTLPTLGTKVDLPQRVLNQAAEKGIDPTTIKLEQGKWLECTDRGCTVLLEATKEEIAKYTKPEILKGLRTGDVVSITGHAYSTHRIEAEKKYGIPGLGTFTTEKDGTKTFTPDAEFKGTVTRGAQAKTSANSAQSSTQSKPTKTAGAEVVEVPYSKDNLKKIHERLTLELDKTFVFVISVPSLCPPCRAYKQELKNAAGQYSAGSSVVFLTVNFDSFEQARQVMGAVKLFPTTIVMPAIKSEKFTYEKDPNWATKPFLQVIKRPGYLVEGAKQSGPLREIVSQTLSVTENSVRGITRSLRELLGTGR